MTRTRVLVAIALLAAVAAGAFMATNGSELKFHVVGSCTTKGGVLKSASSGFTPNGTYATEARYPTGNRYVGLENPGIVSPEGETPEWDWDCADGANNRGDPPGVYHLKIIDLVSGDSVDTTLRVGKP